jgi:hypothetical protein
MENTYANVPNERFDPSELKGIIDKSEMSVGDATKKYLEAINNSKKGAGLGNLLAGSIATSHPLIGAGLFAYNIATKPIQHFNKLAEIERLVGKVTNSVSNGASAIFSGAAKKAIPAAGPISGLMGKNSSDRHSHFSEKLMAMNNNPSNMIDTFASNTENIHDAAPQIAQSIQSAAVRASQFLASKNPSQPQSSPFEEKEEPSAAEVSQFNRYRDITENPMHALEQVRDGTLGPETIETLNTVYPKLYDHMKQAVLQAAGKQLQKGPIPYSTRQQVSFFLGQPIDGSLSPMAIQANQQTHMMAQQQNQAPGPTKPSKAGMGKITLSKRSGIPNGQMEA